MARNYARILFLEHYLFLEAYSIPGALPPETVRMCMSSNRSVVSVDKYLSTFLTQEDVIVYISSEKGLIAGEYGIPFKVMKHMFPRSLRHDISHQISTFSNSSGRPSFNSMTEVAEGIWVQVRKLKEADLTQERSTCSC